MPKSQLQCYGETVYCIEEDLLRRCTRGNSSLERFTNVVAWSISTTRPPLFGLAPYNPVFGETHHVSRGSLHVLLEQVNPVSVDLLFYPSHHLFYDLKVSLRPPVSALHATDEEEGVELLWCQKLAPKFVGEYLVSSRSSSSAL